ncbi:hypothetical protein [Hyphomicrobium sp.]|uniref:hypothetical protein n=1 Tax=Hyphomicrobium sp. TaxID=82 RepID=UPI003F6F7E31
MKLWLTPLLALILSAGPAAAAPLEPQACKDLNTERDAMIGAGIKSDMDRGPEWAKTNLAEDRLKKIERLISVEEQLSFRCGQLVTASPQIKEPPTPPEEKAAAATGAKPAADEVFSGLGFGDVPAPKRKPKKNP